MAWHLDGFTNAEISSCLEMSSATVRSNLRHARTTLKSLFLARWQEGEAND
jgi:DNA-directed RNA polymerase specialized sigma24 family protein